MVFCPAAMPVGSGQISGQNDASGKRSFSECALLRRLSLEILVGGILTVTKFLMICIPRIGPPRAAACQNLPQKVAFSTAQQTFCFVGKGLRVYHEVRPKICEGWVRQSSAPRRCRRPYHSQIAEKVGSRLFGSSRNPKALIVPLVSLKGGTTSRTIRRSFASCLRTPRDANLFARDANWPSERIHLPEQSSLQTGD
jgi:hypothetical protein